MKTCRRNSAPALLETPRSDGTLSDTPSYDYTTSSDTSEISSSSGENTDKKNVYEDRPGVVCEGIQHCRLICLNGKCKKHLQKNYVEKHQNLQYARSDRDTSPLYPTRIPATTKYTRIAHYAETFRTTTGHNLERLAVDGGNDTEPFEAFLEDNHFENDSSLAADTNAESPGNGYVVSYMDRNDTSLIRYLLPVQQHHYCDLSSIETAISAIDRRQNSSTLPSNFHQRDPEGPNDSLHRNRRLHRHESYYFSLSQDLRHANGDALIIAKVRVSRGI